MVATPFPMEATAGTGDAVDAAATQHLDDRLIAVGDSITAACSKDLCVDGTPSKSWIEWISEASERPASVFAESGASTARILELIPDSLGPFSIGFIHAGTNDVLSARRWNGEAFEADFRRLVGAVKPLSGETVILNLPASLGAGARYTSYGPYLSRRVSQARTIIARTAADTGARLVEPAVWKKNQLWLDGVHPTSTGHRALADAVMSALGSPAGTRRMAYEQVRLRPDFRRWRNAALVRFFTVQLVRGWSGYVVSIAERPTRRTTT